MKKEKVYTVFIPEIASFIGVRKFDDNELLIVSEEIKSKFKNNKLEFDDYVNFIVKKFIPSSILTQIRKYFMEGTLDNDFKYDFLYHSLVRVYPSLDVNNISDLINSLADEETYIKGSSSTSMFNGSVMKKKDLSRIEKDINSTVIGQESALSEVLNSLKLIGTGLETFTSMFFIGPTGVGKTEMSKAIADNFSGKERYFKINCGEYSAKHEYAKLIGSPPGYIGHDTDGILTSKATESSRWILVFDEIEKANEKLFDLLLALLDEGKITDNQGRVLDFSNSIFIFTSNIGLQDNVGVRSIGFGNEEESTYEDSLEGIEKSFKEKFKPEFINRLDSVVYFNTLSKEDASEIAKIHLKKLPIKITKPLVDLIVDNSFSTEYGARNIKRYIKNNITSMMADVILEEGQLAKGYKPIVKKGELITLQALDTQ